MANVNRGMNVLYMGKGNRSVIIHKQKYLLLFLEYRKFENKKSEINYNYLRSNIINLLMFFV
jgi:hypothetical protein